MVNNDERYKPRPVEMPSEDAFLDRPFFAYGIFQKGQLAYSKIADCVSGVDSDDVPREMHIRDGVPLIINEESVRIAKGNKIYFLDDKKDEAYSRISATEPGNIYQWDTIDIDGEIFNILVTENLKGTFLNVDDEGVYRDYYDGNEDPIFSRVSEFIRNELENVDYDDDLIFKFQMHYMLLWTAIDRYCVLKYDVSENQSDYLKALSDDEIFKEALRSVNLRNRKAIYSAINATPFYFNLNRPNFIVNYFYTIRCNVAHRGKEIRNNIDALRNSLYDLLDIFDYIIEKTFEDNS